MYDLFLSQIDKRRRVLYSHFAVYIDYLIDALNVFYVFYTWLLDAIQQSEYRFYILF